MHLSCHSCYQFHGSHFAKLLTQLMDSLCHLQLQGKTASPALAPKWQFFITAPQFLASGLPADYLATLLKTLYSTPGWRDRWMDGRMDVLMEFASAPAFHTSVHAKMRLTGKWPFTVLQKTCMAAVEQHQRSQLERQGLHKTPG